MAFTVRRIDYFYINVQDSRGAGYEALAGIAEQGVNLVAITAVPYGPTRMENGQNTGARPLVTQVQGAEIVVVSPAEYATHEAVFPRPA